MELGRRSERRRGASPIGFGLALVAALALPLVAVQAWSAILVLLSIAGYMFALNVIFARLTAVHEPDHNATRTLLPIEKRLIRHTIVAFSITAGVVILGVVRLIGVGVVLFVALMASLLVGASAADTARH